MAQLTKKYKASRKASGKRLTKAPTRKSRTVTGRSGSRKGSARTLNTKSRAVGKQKGVLK